MICTNPLRDEKQEKALEIAEKLGQAGFETTMHVLSYVTEEPVSPRGEELFALQCNIKTADAIIALGGDGTILHLARAAAPYEVPILAVNMGTKGFMAEIEPDEIDTLVAQLRHTNPQIENRMMVDVFVRREGKCVFQDFALNDVVARGETRIIDIEIQGDGETISSFMGDGIIITTPTGSTAYSMAAGGPIIEPTAKNLGITPICAHALVAKSFVLTPEREVRVWVGLSGGKRAYLSVDGGRFTLLDGDEIYVRKSQYITRFIKAKQRSFYQMIHEKLGAGA